MLVIPARVVNHLNPGSGEGLAEFAASPFHWIQSSPREEKFFRYAIPQMGSIRQESPGFCFPYLCRLCSQIPHTGRRSFTKTKQRKQGRRIFTSPCPGAVPERSYSDPHHVRSSSSTLKTDGSRSPGRKAFLMTSLSGYCMFHQRGESQLLRAIVGDKRQNLSVRHSSEVAAECKKFDRRLNIQQVSH